MPQHMAAAPPTQTARREMSGPSGVDDILKTFEEIRQAEQQQTMNFPSNPPMSMNMASEIQSVTSEDMGSVRTDNTGGRRRRRQAPTGNVVSLNV
jgi:hypothetical protein